MRSLKKQSADLEWMSVPENAELHRELKRDVLQKVDSLYYTYEPYFNRRDGEPGWQWQYLRAIDKYKGRVALGGNRIGKSDQGAYECMLAVTGDHPCRHFPANGEGWVVGLDYNMVKTINLPKFEKFIPPGWESHFTNQDNKPCWEIWNDERHWTIRFKSSDSGRAKFQGAEVDFIWFDEEPSKTDIFNECMMRLMDRAGIWWMTATPVMGTIWLKNLSERDSVFSTTGSTWDNPYIPMEEILKQAEDLPEDDRLVRIEGHYIVFGGRPVFDIKILQELHRKALREVEPTLGIVRNYAA